MTKEKEKAISKFIFRDFVFYKPLPKTIAMVIYLTYGGYEFKRHLAKQKRKKEKKISYLLPNHCHIQVVFVTNIRMHFHNFLSIKYSLYIYIYI